MKVQMIRSTIKAEHMADIDETSKRLFAALDREQPQGMRYTTYLLPDGVTFVILLELGDGVDNPLLAMPEAQAVQEGLKQWRAEPPAVEQLTLVRSYRSF